MTSSRVLASTSLRVSTFPSAPSASDKNAAVPPSAGVAQPQAARAHAGGPAERGAGRRWLIELSGIAAAGCRKMRIPVPSHPDIGPPHSKRRAAHGWDVRASPASEPVSSQVVSAILDSSKAATVRRRLAALNPASAARSKAGSQRRPPMRAPSRPPRPLTPPGPGTGSPLARRREPWLRVRHAARQHRPRRNSGPSGRCSQSQHAATTRPRLVDTDRMFVTSRQSGISTAHVDGWGATRLQPPPQDPPPESTNALHVTTNLKQMMYLRRAR